MSGILASRTVRRRGIAYALLVAASLGLMAFSSAPPVRELQRGVGFAVRPIQGVLTDVVRGASSVVGAIGEIDRLRRDNEALRDENSRLQAENSRLQVVRHDNEQLTALLQLRGSLDFTTVAAAVIARESSEYRRVISIDKGTADGLAVGDVVIASGGTLVGRVTDAGATYSHVLLINDTSSTVIGQAGTTAATGEVVGQLGGVLIMRNIDATERITLGDEVVTAGIELAGGIRSQYPKGLLIGQVIDVRRDANDVVQTAYLQAAADLDKLEYVLVITDYQGGLPPPDQQPVPCGGPGTTLPQGEQPCYTPTPAPKPSPTH